MSRIVLIHGFATGIQFSIFRASRDSDAGFSGFREALETGEASVFRWGLKEAATFWQTLNPWYTKRVYHFEQEAAESHEVHQELEAFLKQENPQMIICHSMGCYLLLKYLKRYALPSSVRMIVFNQADVDSSALILSSSITSAIRSGALRFVNVYCFWDLTLLASAFVFVSRRVGLIPAKHSFIENKFFALRKPWNIHTSAIRDGHFYQLTKELLSGKR